MPFLETGRQPTTVEIHTDEEAKMCLEDALASVGWCIHQTNPPTAGYLPLTSEELQTYTDVAVKGWNTGAFLETVNQLQRITRIVTPGTIRYLHFAIAQATEYSLPKETINTLYQKLALDTVRLGKSPLAHISSLTGGYNEPLCDQMLEYIQSVPLPTDHARSSSVSKVLENTRDSVASVKAFLRKRTDDDMGCITNAVRGGYIHQEADIFLKAVARTPDYKVWISPFRKMTVKDYYYMVLADAIKAEKDQFTRGDFSLAAQSANTVVALKPDQDTLTMRSFLDHVEHLVTQVQWQSAREAVTKTRLPGLTTDKRDSLLDVIQFAEQAITYVNRGESSEALQICISMLGTNSNIARFLKNLIHKKLTDLQQELFPIDLLDRKSTKAAYRNISNYLMLTDNPNELTLIWHRILSSSFWSDKLPASIARIKATTDLIQKSDEQTTLGDVEAAYSGLKNAQHRENTKTMAILLQLINQRVKQLVSWHLSQKSFLEASMLSQALSDHTFGEDKEVESIQKQLVQEAEAIIIDIMNNPDLDVAYARSIQLLQSFPNHKQLLPVILISVNNFKRRLENQGLPSAIKQKLIMYIRQLEFEAERLSDVDGRHAQPNKAVVATDA